MSTARRLYHRLDEWVRSLSRIQYAFLAGITSAMALFVFGTLVAEHLTFEAVALGISIAIAYYAFNPDNKD
ncbi:hypothetical protein [Haladaptatus sp. NG-SE-30]